jgi:hypothetical protein
MERQTHRSHQVHRERSLVVISTQDLSSPYGSSENDYPASNGTGAHILGFPRLENDFCMSLSFQFKLSAIARQTP